MGEGICFSLCRRETMRFFEGSSFLLAVAAAVCWGTYGTFATLLKSCGLEGGTISLLMPICYGIFFLVLVLRDSAVKLRVAPKFRGLLLLFGLEAAIFNAAVVKAYSYLPIAIVSTLVFCNLFLLMLFSRLFFGVKVSRAKAVAAFLAVAGVALVLNIFDADCAWCLPGLAWTGLALFAWAAAVTTEKYLLLRDLDSNVILVYNGFFAVIFLSFYTLPWQAVADLGQALAASNGLVLLPLAGLALLPAILSYRFSIAAVKSSDPGLVQLGFVMDPLTASILGFFVLGQTLLPVQIAGMVLILAVVVWVQWLEVKAARLPTKTP